MYRPLYISLADSIYRSIKERGTDTEDFRNWEKFFGLVKLRELYRIGQNKAALEDQERKLLNDP